MHWDDKADNLTIGDRRGSFPGMLEHRTFRVVRVTDTQGVGLQSMSKFDAAVEFEGKAVVVQLPSGRQGTSRKP